MKSVSWFVLVIVIIFLLSQICQAGGDMKFPVQLSYVSGLGDVYDLYVDNLEARGYDISSDFYLPIALSFHPFYEFDFGLRIGGGIGPIMLVLVQEKTIYGSSSSTDYTTYFDLPLNFHVGYTIVPRSPVSPYVKTGFVYHVNTGDYLKSTKPGFLVAAGLDFLRTKRVNFGFEVAKDFSESTFEHRIEEDWTYYTTEKTISTGGLTIGIFVRF
jgi:hypothetical protein